MGPLNSNRLRVLLEDGFSVGKGTGIGRYTQNLATGLKGTDHFELVNPPPRNLISKIRPSSARRVLYSAWLETSLQRYLRRVEPDIIHFTNYLVPRTRLSKAKYVVTIHDLVAWRVPEAIPPMYARYIRSAVTRAAKCSDLILCPSHSIRSDVVEKFGVESRKVVAIPVAPAIPSELSSEKQRVLAGRLRSRLGLKASFLLFVGTLEYRKNVVTLVKAFGKVAARHDLQIVMVGRPGYRFGEIQAAITEQNLPDRYVVPGFLSDDELAALYMLADAFIYPSLYEGFGIPLLEAMSMGLPVIASRIPSTEEIGADAISYYGHPLDAPALADKITQVITQPDLKPELIEKGKRRAGQFSREQIINQYQEAYRSILE